ncbi:MAG: lysylphosphatidylglycerol synthase domain-containing protein [Syntrophales bacterium]
MKRDEDPENAGIDGEEVQPARPRRQKIFSFIFRFAVSVVLLLWIFKSIDLGIFEEVVVSPRLLPIIAMIGFSLFYVFLGGLKLWVLFRGFSPISLRLFTGYFFLAGSVGSLAPAIFGDLTMVGLARQSLIPVHASVSAIIMDRFITMVIALFIFTPFTLIYILPVKPLFIMTLMGMLALLLGCLIWVALRFAPSLFDKLSATRRFWESFTLYFRGDRKKLYVNALIGCFRGIVSGITLILALMAANVSPPFFATICITNSLSVLTHIPVSLSGLGIYEGGGLVLFEALGLNREQVLAGLFYQRVYIIFWSLLTAAIWGVVVAVKQLKKGTVDL